MVYATHKHPYIQNTLIHREPLPAGPAMSCREESRPSQPSAPFSACKETPEDLKERRDLLIHSKKDGISGTSGGALAGGGTGARALPHPCKERWLGGKEGVKMDHRGNSIKMLQKRETPTYVFLPSRMTIAL